MDKQEAKRILTRTLIEWAFAFTLYLWVLAVLRVMSYEAEALDLLGRFFIVMVMGSLAHRLFEWISPIKS